MSGCRTDDFTSRGLIRAQVSFFSLLVDSSVLRLLNCNGLAVLTVKPALANRRFPPLS